MSTTGGRRLSATGVVAALVLSLLTAWSAPAHADAAGKGGDFVPLAAPARFVDTRSGTGGVTGARGAGSTTTFPVLGQAGVPSSGVSAVLVDLTPISPTVATYLQLWADGTPRPSTSNINVAAGNVAISNSAVVPVGANGRIALYNNAGSVHVVLDVHGYFTSTAGTGRGGFVPVTQTTLFDTANGVGVPKATIPARGSLTVQATGGVVPAGANALFLNVVVSGATASSWLRATATGGAQGTGTSIDFSTGTTSSGLVVKPAADGRVTFYNNSSATINLRASVAGYFSATSAQGAGYRPAFGRIIGGSTLQPDATLDVQVAGLYGMPARGVAGVALNLTVGAPTGYGYLRAYPLGTAEPTAMGLNHFSPNLGDADMTIVKPGAEGRVRIKNVSTGTIKLYVDVQGWFADPVPPVAVRQYTRMTAFQTTPPAGATVGTVEYSYVDNIGRLVHGHQPDPDNFGSVQWTTISGNEAFSGPPSATQLADGSLQVVGQNTTSEAMTAARTGTTWAAWSGVGGFLPGPPVIAKLPDGTPVAFATDADGVLWRRTLSGTNTEWRVMGDLNLAGEVVAVTVRDGIQVFGVDTAGGLRGGLYSGTGFTGVVNFGGTGLSGVPAVVVYPGHRLRVVVRGTSGVVTKVQDVNGVFPAAWETVGSLQGKGSPAALLSPLPGTAEIVMRGQDDELYSTGETAQGSGVWRDWKRLVVDAIGQPISDPSATDPTAFPITNANGQSWAVVFRNLNNQARIYWVAPNG